MGNIGIASYLFEGNGVILNVKAETKNRHIYHIILILAVALLCGIVVLLSGIVYYVYGDQTETMFTLNLQPMNPLICSIMVGFCLATFPIYPGTILAVFDMIEQRSFFRQRHRQLIMRMTIILLVTVIALFVPNFAFFTNVIGAVCCSAIAFIYPPVLYNAQFRSSITCKRKLLHYFVILFGTFGGVVSLYTSICSLQ